MRGVLLTSLLVPLAASAPQLHPRAARYEGYKVLRMDTGDQLEKVKDMLSGFDYEEWSHDTSKHIDFSLPADQAKKLKRLGAKFKEMHGNLGKDIANEGKPCDYKRMFILLMVCWRRWLIQCYR